MSTPQPVKHVSTIVDLRSYTGEADGEAIILDAYHADLNTGGGVFVWDADSTVADDGGIHIRPNSITIGRWIRRLFSGSVSPEMFGAFNDGTTDDTDAFVAAVNNGNPVELLKGQSYYLPTGASISGREDLSLTGNGALLLAPGKTLAFVDCPRLVLDISVRGSTLPKALLSSFTQIDSTHTSLTLSEMASPGDDYVNDLAAFSVGDAIQVIRVMDDGLEVVAYRGTIAARSGEMLTVENDTSLGGGYANLVTGQGVVLDASPTHYPRLELTRCNHSRVNGYYEISMQVTNCTGFSAGQVSMYKAGMSLQYCNGAHVDSFESIRSSYYGFAAFKSRGLGLGNIRTDKAGVGGVVLKDIWEFGCNAMDIRRARCYGLQLRDDTGTPPQQVNADLQPTLEYSEAGHISRLTILDSNRGIWIDDDCYNLSFGLVTIRGTAAGASVLYEGGHGVSFQHLEIVDHFIHGLPDAYYLSTVPLSIARGDGLRIGKLVMASCRHGTAMISTSTSGHKNLLIEDSDISDCNNTVQLGSLVGGRVSIRGSNPMASIGAFISVAGAQDLVLEGCSFETGNEYNCSSFISIQGSSRNIHVSKNVAKSGVTLAGVYIDAEGDNIRVSDNDLLASSSYGVTVRGASTRVLVDRNNIQNAGTSLHKSGLTATDYVIRGSPKTARVDFSAATLAAGAQDYVDVAMLGVGPTQSVEISIAVTGTSLGLQYWGIANTTNSVRVWRRNGGADSMQAPSSNVVVTAVQAL